MIYSQILPNFCANGPRKSNNQHQKLRLNPNRPTELLPWAKFSRHAKAQTSLTLDIWLNENILIPTFSLMNFPGEASHTYFFRRKVSASRILQVPGALFPEFFQKLFAVCRASNKNFSRTKVATKFFPVESVPRAERYETPGKEEAPKEEKKTSKKKAK